ncbi:MAG: hypothetical protein ACFFBP_01250 [Promethearchaeota archaeon]
MLKEKLKNDKINNIIANHREKTQYMKKEQNSVRNFIFSEMIRLINNKDKFMLGPEKTKAASFIADNYLDVYKYLNNLLKNNIFEGLD